MERLKIKPIKQENKFDCGPTCIAMISDYYKFKIDYSLFLKNIIRNDGKVNIFYLAKALKTTNKNLKIKISFFNFKYFDVNFNKLSKDEKIKYMTKIKTEDLDYFTLTAIKRCIYDDIEIEHKLFGVDDLQKRLLEKNPVITLVSVQDFREIKSEEWRGHYIVVNGFHNNVFYYTDPHWEANKFGEHNIKSEKLLISIAKTRFPAFLEILNGS